MSIPVRDGRQYHFYGTERKTDMAPGMSLQEIRRIIDASQPTEHVVIQSPLKQSLGSVHNFVLTSDTHPWIFP
jgi:hypothetical protein